MWNVIHLEVFSRLSNTGIFNSIQNFDISKKNRKVFKKEVLKFKMEVNLRMKCRNICKNASFFCSFLAEPPPCRQCTSSDACSLAALGGKSQLRALSPGFPRPLSTATLAQLFLPCSGPRCLLEAPCSGPPRCPSGEAGTCQPSVSPLEVAVQWPHCYGKLNRGIWLSKYFAWGEGNAITRNFLARATLPINIYQSSPCHSTTSFPKS